MRPSLPRDNGGTSSPALYSSMVNRPLGTVVSVLYSGTEIASVSVNASGQYSNLQVPADGIFVTFTVDALPAAETATTQAGGFTTLDLNTTRH